MFVSASSLILERGSGYNVAEFAFGHCDDLRIFKLQDKVRAVSILWRFASGEKIGAEITEPGNIYNPHPNVKSAENSGSSTLKSG